MTENAAEKLKEGEPPPPEARLASKSNSGKLKIKFSSSLLIPEEDIAGLRRLKKTGGGGGKKSSKSKGLKNQDKARFSSAIQLMPV